MIYAVNANNYQVLEAIKHTSSAVSAAQSAVKEWPIYVNASETEYPTNTSSYWLRVCLTGCGLTNEDLSKLQTYFTGTSIKFLDLSYNNALTLLAIVKFIVNCNNVQNLQCFDKKYDMFCLSKILSSLVPGSIARSLETEIIYCSSTVFVLCESYLCIDDCQKNWF